VNGTAVGRVVIAIGIVVGGVPVEKAVGHDLINTLRLPEFVGRILGDRTSRNEAERDRQACGAKTPRSNSRTQAGSHFKRASARPGQLFADYTHNEDMNHESRGRIERPRDTGADSEQDDGAHR